MMMNTPKNEENKEEEFSDYEKLVIEVLSKEGPMTEEQLIQRCKEVIGLKFFEDDKEEEDDMQEPAEYAESYAANQSSESNAVKSIRMSLIVKKMESDLAVLEKKDFVERFFLDPNDFNIKRSNKLKNKN